MNDDVISNLLEEYLNESLSYKDIFNIINDSTENFSKESGKVRFNTRYENNLANDILIQAYSAVENKEEPDLDENNDLVYEISYSNPIRESLFKKKPKFNNDPIVEYAVTKNGVRIKTFPTESAARHYIWDVWHDEGEGSHIDFKVSKFVIEELDIDEMNQGNKNKNLCPECKNNLSFVGYQGNFIEYKCPECNKYWYHDGEDLFDENDLNWDESRGLYIKESKNRRKRRVKPDDGKLHFYDNPVKGVEWFNHATSSGDGSTGASNQVSSGGGIGENFKNNHAKEHLNLLDEYDKDHDYIYNYNPNHGERSADFYLDNYKGNNGKIISELNDDLKELNRYDNTRSRIEELIPYHNYNAYFKICGEFGKLDFDPEREKHILSNLFKKYGAENIKFEYCGINENRGNPYFYSFGFFKTPDDVEESIEGDPQWVDNTINKVSNTDKDPSVIATKEYHKRHPKKLKKGEMIVSSLSEKIENHNELNQDLFEDEELKPEVKDKLLEIVEKFKDYLKQDEIDLDIKDVQIVGSNAGYNYTDDSDIDLHIIADLSIYQNQEELAEKLYLAYKSLFNDKYDPTIYGHPVEVYVEPYQEVEHE